MLNINKIFLLVTILQAICGDCVNIDCATLDDFYNYEEHKSSHSFVPRAEWGAQPPSNELTNLSLPVHRIIIAHTGTRSCLTKETCISQMRFLQEAHIALQEFDDITYNFLIDSSGFIYIGRGWDKKGESTKGYNSDSISIAFIGTFNATQPPPNQLNAAKFLIREGLKIGKIASDYKLYGQSQLIKLKNPETNLLEIIEKWPGFVTDVDTGAQKKKICGTPMEEDSTFRFINRQNWIAQPPTSELTNLVHPIKYVIISQTATDICETQAECTFRVRLIQTFHMEAKSYDDIGYNFLIGGDGSVYEGRGWDKVGVHTREYNQISIGIAFIGFFNEIKPTESQLRAAKLLIADGVRLGKLNSNYILKGHRQFIATESPGLALLNCIKTWPHFCDEQEKCNTIQNSTSKYVSRSQWNAEEPTSSLDNLTLPAHRVIIAHTVTRSCNSQMDCIELIKSIQNFHINSRNFNDICYNFLVDDIGTIYEGRGWSKVGAHTKNYNIGSVGIAFIGTFNTNTPTADQINAIKSFLNEGVTLGKLTTNYEIYGQRQLIPTESPGQILFREISTWPHFASTLQQEKIVS